MSTSLLDIFKVGAGAYVDGQAARRATVNDPTYNTQDGTAGQSQFTSFG